MLKLKQKICKCGKKALPNRRICYSCHLAVQRIKRDGAKATRMLRKAVKTEKLHNSLAYLKPIAWKAFSRHIRMKYADDNGMVKCYTCPTVKHYKEMQAGHLWHDRLDFDERNIHPQCYQCNVGHSGRREVYSTNLLDEGIDLKQLRRDAETKHYTCQELKEIINKFSPLHP